MPSHPEGPGAALRCLVALVAAATSVSVVAGCARVAADGGVADYRSWVVGADVAAASLIASAHVAESEPLLMAGAVTYFVGAPLAHLAHRNFTGAELSGRLRGVAPTGGAALGYAIGYAICDDACGVTFAVVGTGVGALMASVIDATYLARGGSGPERDEPFMVRFAW
jgi:hypothetical protein